MTFLRLSFLLLSITLAHGYVSTSFSTFTGAGASGLLYNPRNSCPRYSSTRGTLEMKKGKDGVPIQMRGNYVKQKQMMEARDAMMAAQNPKDGVPVFNLFVRSKLGASVGFVCGVFVLALIFYTHPC